MKITTEEWKKKLAPEKYHVLREKGTEPAGSGKFAYHKEKGMYVCGGCGAELFPSDMKFDSGTGWPSFYDAKPGAVEFKEDRSQGMIRTEVGCETSGGHLGHGF